MHWLVGNWTEIGHTAAKVVLMYVTAVVALRLGERRTLAQWTIIDSATADYPPYANGAVALVMLVADGRLRTKELRRCGLTENDLYAHLRQRGFFSLDDLRFVLYETKGGITAVPRDASPAEPLVDVALQNAADYPSREIDPAP